MDAVHPLLGRDAETLRLAQLAGHARNGRGGALLVVGEPGIGKTALLDSGSAQGAGLRVLRVDGVEPESCLPYAALQRLALPLDQHRSHLPPRLAEALAVASGAADGPVPDRFLVGLALLTLLSAASDDEPLLCCLDDVHLLDRDSLEVLLFVARRLTGLPVALLMAARDLDHHDGRFHGIESLGLSGLDLDSGIALLTRSLEEPVERPTAAAIVQATGGNPLALVDLAQELTAEDAYTYGLSGEPIPVGPYLEAHYARCVDLAGDGVAEWTLVASAERTGHLELVAAAAKILDIDEDAQNRAEAAGLVQSRARLRFRHPLVESAVHARATGSRLREVHAALAVAAADLLLDDPELWHLSRAAVGTHPELADRLARAAGTAGSRGSRFSQAQMLVRAGELSVPGSTREQRFLDAAEAAFAGGEPKLAEVLLGRVGSDPDPVSRGRYAVLRALVERSLSTGGSAAPTAPALLRAADQFRGHDTRREVATLLTTFDHLVSADPTTQTQSVRELGARLGSAAASTSALDAAVAAGLAAMIVQPYAEAAPVARRALDEILALPDERLMRRGTAVVSLSTFLWDDAARQTGLGRAIDAARAAGALQLLQELLWSAALVDLMAGDARGVSATFARIREVRAAMGDAETSPMMTTLLTWAAQPRSGLVSAADAMTESGHGAVGTSLESALSLRDLAQGNYLEARVALVRLASHPFAQVANLHLAGLAEVGRHTGHVDEARANADRLVSLADVNGSAWGRGVAHRTKALLVPPNESEPLFRSALDLLGTTTCVIDLARAHLAYGEFLRRQRRRAEAQEQLARSLDVFERHQNGHLAERARRELGAAGARLRRQPITEQRLTTQEASVARLAAESRTNTEIATALFISPNTVDYHLRKVFAKLGISSRRQLSDVIAVALAVE